MTASRVQRVAWTLQVGGIMLAGTTAAVWRWPEALPLQLAAETAAALAPTVGLTVDQYFVMTIGLYGGMFIAGWVVDVAINGAWGLFGIWRPAWQQALRSTEERAEENETR